MVNDFIRSSENDHLLGSTNLSFFLNYSILTPTKYSVRNKCHNCHGSELLICTMIDYYFRIYRTYVWLIIIS